MVFRSKQKRKKTGIANNKLKKTMSESEINKGNEPVGIRINTSGVDKTPMTKHKKTFSCNKSKVVQIAKKSKDAHSTSKSVTGNVVINSVSDNNVGVESHNNSLEVLNDKLAINTLLSFCFMSEKKVDKGEDSDPLLLTNDSFAVVGVFDGMGGAGSAMHILGTQEKTGAYFASRRVEQATELFFSGFIDNSKPGSINPDSVADELKQVIKAELSSLKEECPPKIKSGLKSAMIKEFPTTLSLAALRKKNDVLEIISLWAGDSRNYILTSKGLYQISIDDLETKGDPLQNLSSDSPLSNQVCADRDFTINKRVVGIQEQQFVVFSVTDGCFGYYPTPIHFEDSLLRTLAKASTEQEWRDLLRDEFSSVAADDTSMACFIYGFDDFLSFKRSMRTRTQFVANIIGEYEEYRKKLTEAKAVVFKYEEDFKLYKQNVWDEYKVEYMSHIL